MSVRSASASKGWWGWKSIGQVRRREGRHVQEGQRAQLSAPSVPCSTAAGTNARSHPVLDMPIKERVRNFHGDVRVEDDLQAFEDVRAVVEARARRVQIEWSVWFDLWWGPSTFRREVHVEHVVRHDLSKI